MSVDEIKRLLYRLNDEVMNDGKLELIEEMFDANYAMRHGTQREEADYGHEAVRRRITFCTHSMPTSRFPSMR